MRFNNRTIKLYQSFEKSLIEIGEITLLFFNSMKSIFKKPFENKVFFKQMTEIGIRSMPVVTLTCLFTGMIFSLQSYIGFKRFGAEIYTGSVIGIGLTKELIPVLTALMIAGRVGSAMAAEIGTMKVTEQIDALLTLGTNPIKFLIVPRVLAGTIMTPILTIYGDAIGLIGAYFVAVNLMGLNPIIYNQFQLAYMEVWDIISGLIKSFSFGVIISLIGCYKGLKTEGGAEGVGKSTTSAVVLASILILITNFFWGKLLPFTLKR